MAQTSPRRAGLKPPSAESPVNGAKPVPPILSRTHRSPKMGKGLVFGIDAAILKVLFPYEVVIDPGRRFAER